jgi:hypothetical protein
VGPGGAQQRHLRISHFVAPFYGTFPANDVYGEPDPLDRLIGMLGPKLDELRSFLDEATTRWRGDAVRFGEGSRQRLNAFFYEAGLITREDWDTLDLRAAQLEHRLRLIEERLDKAESED